LRATAIDLRANGLSWYERDLGISIYRGDHLVYETVSCLCGAISRTMMAGDSRTDYGLADLFSAHWIGSPRPERAGAAQTLHSYLRLSPELRAGVWGPETGDEPKVSGQRHPVLRGFEETDLLPYGGTLTALKLDSGVSVPLTFVPPFPVLPPETAWMRGRHKD
jgi:hypothetical protein